MQCNFNEKHAIIISFEKNEDKTGSSPFSLRHFLTTKKILLRLYILYLSRYKGAIARSSFHGNLLRVLRLTRYDVRGEAEKPSCRAAESRRSISQRKGDFMILFSTPSLCFVLQVITFFIVADLIRLVEPVRKHIVRIISKLS